MYLAIFFCTSRGLHAPESTQHLPSSRALSSVDMFRSPADKFPNIEYVIPLSRRSTVHFEPPCSGSDANRSKVVQCHCRGQKGCSAIRSNVGFYPELLRQDALRSQPRCSNWILISIHVSVPVYLSFRRIFGFPFGRSKDASQRRLFMGRRALSTTPSTEGTW
jgi:hypothetical protein